jgi:AcrR family transcriptional regulator
MSQKVKQRARTHRALLRALQAELLKNRRLTVEAVATRARVNKALVYRYFGGLPGLIAAFAASDEFMPGAEELRHLCGEEIGSRSPRERFIRCIQAYVKALERRPATVQLLLRLPAMPSETLEALADGRARALEQIRELFGDQEIAPNYDRELAFNLLISGICQLLGSRHDSWTRGTVALEDLSQRIIEAIGAMLLKDQPVRPA